MILDEEHKITEFDYENYIDPALLTKDTTSSPEFKKLIKALNIFSQSEQEKFKEQKEQFSKLMPMLRNLTPDEYDTFIHLVKNKGRSLGSTNNDLLDEMTMKTVEEKLAKISEEENYNSKNRYRL